MNDKKGAILIISGPSGCGKSTLLKEVYKNISDYYFSISTTTREPRVGEVNGVDYFFVSKEEFEEDINEDGARRFAWIFPEELESNYKEDKNWIELQFYLPKGSYATEVIAEIIH